MPTIVAVILVVVGVILLYAVCAAVPVYFLWNWLMPAIFGLHVITFWQSFGLCLLCGILFKGSSSSSKDK